MNRRQFALGLLAAPWIARAATASPPPSLLRLAAPDEPGQRIAVSGRIVRADGRPAAGARLFVYHTDATGLYGRPVSDARRARLRGWVECDGDGRYAIETILPGHYPGRDAPRHIHVHVHAPGLPPHWIDNIHFAGDPKLRRDTPGVVALRADRGILRGVRDIRVDRATAEAQQLVNGWYR